VFLVVPLCPKNHFKRGQKGGHNTVAWANVSTVLM
jgi:hypothetical protein